MKCPNCKFTCSDLRDICIKCELDLRPHKKSIGLKASYPDLSYEELLEKVRKKRGIKESPFESAETRRMKAAKKSRFPLADEIISRFKKLFFERIPPPSSHASGKGMSVDPNESNSGGNPWEAFSVKTVREKKEELGDASIQKTEIITRDSASALSAAGDDTITNTGQNTEESDSSDSSDKASSPRRSPFETKIQKAPSRDEYGEESTGMDLFKTSLFDVSLLKNIKDGDISIKQLTEKDESGMPQSSGNLPEEGDGIYSPPTPPEEDEREPEGEKVVIKELDEEFPDSPPVNRPPGEPLKRRDRPESYEKGNDKSERPPKVPIVKREEKKEALQDTERRDQIPEGNAEPFISYAALDHARIKKAFSGLSSSIPVESGELEFSPWQFKDYSRDQDIKVLFNMTEEAILNPESEKKYTNEVKISRKRELKTDVLQAQLKRTIRQLNAPVFNLKGGIIGRKEKSEHEEARVRIPELIIAPRRLRLLSFIVDSCLVSVIAFLSAFYFFMAFNPIISSKIMTGEPLRSVELVTFLAVFIYLFIVCFALYQICSHLFFGNTAGARICGLELRKDNGFEISWRNTVARTMLYPVSAAMFGYLPILFNRRPLHDALSNTVLCRIVKK